MEILFDDSDLRDAIQLGSPWPGMPEAVRPRARHMLRLLESIPDIRTLKNWKSAGYRPAHGRSGVSQIQLVDDHHFVVTVNETLNPPTITIIELTKSRAKRPWEPAHEHA